jgi:hypothetical protein
MPSSPNSTPLPAQPLTTTRRPATCLLSWVIAALRTPTAKKMSGSPTARTTALRSSFGICQPSAYCARNSPRVKSGAPAALRLRRREACCSARRETPRRSSARARLPACQPGSRRADRCRARPGDSSAARVNLAALFLASRSVTRSTGGAPDARDLRIPRAVQQAAQTRQATRTVTARRHRRLHISHGLLCSPGDRSDGTWRASSLRVCSTRLRVSITRRLSSGSTGQRRNRSGTGASRGLNLLRKLSQDMNFSFIAYESQPAAEGGYAVINLRGPLRPTMSLQRSLQLGMGINPHLVRAHAHCATEVLNSLSAWCCVSPRSGKTE